MNILLLANRPVGRSQAQTVTEYVDSFQEYSKYQIHEVSMLNKLPEGIELHRFDCIMLHYTLSLGPLINHYLSEKTQQQLAQFSGLKVAFLQDEYRGINDLRRNLNKLGIDLLFSCVPQDQIELVYPRNELSKLKVKNVLTGYVPESFYRLNSLPIKKRKIDVGYRTRTMPFWLGDLAYQ